MAVDWAELPLAELRVALAPLVAQAAEFDGWGDAGVAEAARGLGLDPEVALLAYRTAPGGLPMSAIAAWTDAVDAAVAARFADGSLPTMKIRARIRALVWARLEAIAGREEALRRAQAVMAMPHHWASSARLGWAAADAMWRLAGDQATDLNHYSKRALLGGIYAATLAVWRDDTSENKADTAAFLDRRIDGVMRFEKLKAGLLRSDAEHFSPLRFLGRLRYPS